MAQASLQDEKVIHKSTTITSGTATDALNILGGTLCAVYIPASVASATMTITVSDSATGTFSTLADGLGLYGTAGADVTFTITANKWIEIPPSLSASIKHFKLVFNASETNKTYKLAYRRID